jgi:metal-responsive CopG/Arc/MetJ family transcriptional regulator
MANTSEKHPSNHRETGTRITVTLPPSDYETVCRMAKSKKVSASWIVRDALEKYLAADVPLFSRPARLPQ